MRSFVLKSIDEMPAYEQGWEVLRRQCGGTIYSSYYLTRSWLEAFGGSASPRIVVVEDDGDLVGLAPLCLYRYNVKGIPIKVLSLVGDMRDRLRLSTNSILVRPGRPDVMERIVEEIGGLRWSILWTINMERSPLIDRYMEKVRTNWYPIEREGQDLVIVPLPPVGDVADMFDRGARRNLHRKIKKLEREGFKVELSMIAPGDIDRAVDLYAKQHIERWASKGGSYFRNPENVNFLKLATKAAYERGQGLAGELLINGEVAAQLFTYVEGDQAYGERIGISERHLYSSPGWLILYHMMNEMRSRGVRRLHVGNGAEQYKHVMGGEVVPLAGIGATRGMVALAARLPMFSVARMTEAKELPDAPGKAPGPQ